VLKSQFATNAQNVLRLNQCTRGHAQLWPHFLKDLGTVVSDLTDIKIRRWFLYFQLVLKALGFLNVPTDRILELRSSHYWALPRKPSVFLFYLRGTPIVCPRLLDTLCMRMIFNFFRSRTPRYIFSSTLYPQSCWCIIQVIHNVHLK
jgi:hypothetical protein